MNPQYCAGAVWSVVKDFGLGKGPETKYFVVLSEPTSADGSFLVAMVTSQGEKRYGQQGSAQCGSPDKPYFRIEVGQEKCFPLKTWVQFDNVFETTSAALDARVAAKTAGYLQFLDSGRLRSVLNCLLKAKDALNSSKEAARRTLSAQDAVSSRALAAKKSAQAVPLEKVLNAKELKAALAGKDMYEFEALTGVTAKQVRDLTDFDTETIENIRLGLDLMK